MSKRFRFRFPRIFPSFQSCRSKDPSTWPENPVPVNPNFLKLHLTPAGGHCVTGAASEDDGEAPPKDFRWNKEEKWHVASKVLEIPSSTEVIFNSLVSSPSPTALLETKKKQRINKKKKSKRIRARISTSSADHSEWFSSDVGDDEVDDERNETFVSSSRTLSTDSTSSVDTHELETIRETPIRGSRRRRTRKINSPGRRLRRVKCAYAGKIGNAGNSAPTRCVSTEIVSPARLSVFSWMMPGAMEGKVRESFAVVKKSEDPYEDFKGSMLEMILEKQMVEARDLEQLLQCFLSLNSRNHHEIIVEAFSEIWEAMFCESRLKNLPF